jgi:hypothetical protein
VIKPKTRKLKGYVADMAEMRSTYNILVRKPEGKRTHGRIILKWIIKKYGVRVWTGFI